MKSKDLLEAIWFAIVVFNPVFFVVFGVAYYFESGIFSPLIIPAIIIPLISYPRLTDSYFTKGLRTTWHHVRKNKLQVPSLARLGTIVGAFCFIVGLIWI